MKLVTFEIETPVGRIRRLGALLYPEGASDAVILDLNTACQWALAEQHDPKPCRHSLSLIPPDMLGFIETGEAGLTQARLLIKTVLEQCNFNEAKRYKGPEGQQMIFHLTQARLCPPLPNPPSLKDFIAFEDHIKRGYEIRNRPFPEEWYKHPVYYKGNHRTIFGPNDAIVWPHYTKKLDYELELGCVIGRGGIDIAEDEAMAHIFGLTVLNDFSARDVQFAEMTCRLGPAKGKDFATAIGPCIVTMDEFEVNDQGHIDLKMEARINGEVWSRGQSGTCHWTWPQMVSYLSQGEAVYPGDFLGSGTVGGGCGYEHDKWIAPGDVVELEIEGIGVLKNTIVTAEQQAQKQNNAADAEGSKTTGMAATEGSYGFTC
ncbi:MAG: fumarylacetoacetate hydrolase family protein [Vampirovibrionales bacterium]